MDTPKSAYEKTQPVEACQKFTEPTFLIIIRQILLKKCWFYFHFCLFSAASVGAGKLKARFENLAKASDEENKKKAEEERARRQARENKEREEAKRRQQVTHWTTNIHEHGGWSQHTSQECFC